MTLREILSWIDSHVPDIALHFSGTFIITLISGWQAAAWTAVAVEGLQWWIFGPREWDTLKDLLWDFFGICAGMVVRQLF